MSVSSIGAVALTSATSRFAASAQRTVAAGGDLATEAVEQIEAKAAFDASLAVVRAGDDMSKRLLDIRV